MSDDIARQHRLLNALLDNDVALDQFLKELSTSVVEDGFVATHLARPTEDDVLEGQALRLPDSDDAVYYRQAIANRTFLEELEHFFDCIHTEVDCQVSALDTPN